MSIRIALAAALILASTSAAIAATGGRVSGFVMVALNPQPEPPGAQDSLHPKPVNVTPPQSAVTGTIPITDAAARVALNPQPEPPGITFDARKLPPGPCRNLSVVVKVPGLPPVTSHATATTVAGKCAFDVVIPNATTGSRAAVKFSRDRER
jgi:hypothetical protein